MEEKKITHVASKTFDEVQDEGMNSEMLWWLGEKWW